MARKSWPRDDHVRALAEEVRQARRDLDVQFERIAQMQAQLDHTLMRLDQIASAWKQVEGHDVSMHDRRGRRAPRSRAGAARKRDRKSRP